MDLRCYLSEPSARVPDSIRTGFIAAVTLLIVAELLGAMGVITAPHSMLGINPNRYSPFLAFAVGSVFMTQLVLYGWTIDLAISATAGLIIFGLHLVLLQPSWSTSVPWVGLFSYCLGLGSCIFLTQQIAFRRRTASSVPYAFALQSGLLPALFVLLSWPLLQASSNLPIRTWDAPLWHFENSLGLLISIDAARLFLRYPTLAELCDGVYCSLPLAIGLMFAYQSKQGQQSNLMKAFLIAGIMGSCLYMSYPAAGPRYLLGNSFPLQIPDLGSIPLEPSRISPTFLNAMPSLHMAWALLLWFAGQRLSSLCRYVTGAFVVLTALATLGLGEHYFIDLIVACPLALLVQRLTSPKHTYTSLVIPVVLIAGWLIYLRMNSANFTLVGTWHWLPIIATLVLCLHPRVTRSEPEPG